MLGRRLLLENVSSVSFAADEMSEWEFIAQLAQRADCELLLGQRFGALCALAAESVGDEQAAHRAAGALHGWLGDGLFCGWRID